MYSTHFIPFSTSSETKTLCDAAWQWCEALACWQETSNWRKMWWENFEMNRSVKRSVKRSWTESQQASPVILPSDAGSGSDRDETRCATGYSSRLCQQLVVVLSGSSSPLSSSLLTNHNNNNNNNSSSSYFFSSLNLQDSRFSMILCVISLHGFPPRSKTQHQDPTGPAEPIGSWFNIQGGKIQPVQTWGWEHHEKVESCTLRNLSWSPREPYGAQLEPYRLMNSQLSGCGAVKSTPLFRPCLAAWSSCCDCYTLLISVGGCKWNHVEHASLASSWEIGTPRRHPENHVSPVVALSFAWHLSEAEG